MSVNGSDEILTCIKKLRECNVDELSIQSSFKVYNTMNGETVKYNFNLLRSIAICINQLRNIGFDDVLIIKSLNVYNSPKNDNIFGIPRTYDVQTVAEIVVRLQAKNENNPNGNDSPSNNINPTQPKPMNNNINNNNNNNSNNGNFNGTRVSRSKSFFRKRNRAESKEPIETPFVAYMSANQILQLKMNDEIDFRHDNGKYTLSTIVGVKSDPYKTFKIHHNNWANKWDS